MSDGARSDEEDAVLQNLKKLARIEMVFPAVEAGLQRGMLVMQPAESSLQVSLPVLGAVAGVGCSDGTPNDLPVAIVSNVFVSIRIQMCRKSQTRDSSHSLPFAT